MAVRDALSGRVLGEFVLRERIGEGGFGAVYRCEQPLLGREAVIKVLHTNLRGSEVVLQRFTREAQLASRLDHPYAAHIYAFGVEKDDGLCWIAMELVVGTTLDRWLRDRGPLPLAQLVPFFERVAEVVQTAHEAGIVHRDLKPSNIMVIERAGRLLPKLLDFGIAKMVATKPVGRTTPLSVEVPAVVVRAASQPALPVVAGDEATLLPGAAPPGDDRTPADTPPPVAKPSEVATLPVDGAAPTPNPSPSPHPGSLPQLTRDDATMGSPPYMSPEQWTDATRVGPSADLYALGVVAYEALLGRRPFVATSMSALAGMHCHEPVPPVGDAVPAAFDRFFARALAKAPEDRPATALELAAMLRVAAGIGAAPEDLPRLEEAVRDAWIAEAPQLLAEGVAGLDGARNLHQARDAARDLFRSLVRYLLALALAARAQVRADGGEAGAREALRALRDRELDEDERIRLLRALVRPFAGRRGAYPIPELVDFVGGEGDAGRSALDALLELRPSTENVAAEDVIRSQLVQFLPALGKVLRSAAFVLDYPLVIPRDGAAERWMGMRRQRRTAAVVRDATLAADQAVLLDREGRRALVLAPLLQPVAPTVGADREPFLFEGRGRLGARLVASPAGFEHHDPAVWDWFGEHVLGETEGQLAAREDDRPPYLGLASFAAADADRFVGREREIDAFVNRLRRQALQIVVGPSGAGKSSFVHAGVVPGMPPGWRAITLRPGSSPIAALAARLGAAGVSTTDLRPVLESAPAAAATIVAHAAGDGVIVIVVDQLEELFTLCPSAAERDQFAAALAHLAASADGPTRVICTVRDDFLMHVESLAPLRATLSPALFLIGNPSRDDLVRTIVEPARRAGYELADAELAADMVAVVADRPGALALLSFTASRLWELRDRRFRQLTRKAYDAMGGVAGALGQHAEDTFLSLVADEQRVAREAFRFLVTADLTRAVLRVDELHQRLASPRSEAVVAKLVAARLLAIVEGDAHSQIEIIHEALIAAWPRLQQWTREDTADARSREQIRVAAKQWADRGRPRELLWRGDLLRELARWRTRVTLSDLEAQFADSSQADALRGARIRRALVIVAIGVTAIFIAVLLRANARAAVAAETAEAASKTAETEADKANQANAKTNALLRDSTFDQGRLRMLEGDKLGALPFLASAYDKGETGAANRLLIEEALRPTRATIRTLAGHTDKLWAVAYSPDGTRLATASMDGTARLWDADTGAELQKIQLEGAALTLAFSPDGKYLAIGGRDPQVRLWDVVRGAPVAAFPATGRVIQVAFGPGGSELLVAGEDGLRLWPIAGGGARTAVGLRGIVGARYAADGSRIGAWDQTGHVELLDGRTLRLVRDAHAVGEVHFGAIAPNGRTVVAGTDDGALIWLRDDGSVIRQPSAHTKRIVGLEFSPDGASLVSASADTTARIWGVDGMPRAALVGHGQSLMDVRYSSDGAIIASACADGTVRLWTAEGILVGELTGHSAAVTGLAFRSDGRRIATASWDHTVRVWDSIAAMEFRALPGVTATSQVAYSTDGSRLATTSDDGRITVWTTRDRACSVPTGPPVAYLAWSNDGRRFAVSFELATPGRDGSARSHVVRVFRGDSCELERELDTGAEVYVLAFMADGELGVGSLDGITLWDVDHGSLDRQFAGFHGYVTNLDGGLSGWLIATLFHDGDGASLLMERLDGPRTRRIIPAGKAQLTGIEIDHQRRQIITPSWDHHVWVWDAESGALVTKLESSGPVYDARLSPDGRRMVAVGGSAPAVWDPARWAAPMRPLVGHTDRVTSGQFLDERLLLTAGLDGVARLWDAESSHALLRWPGTSRVVASPATHAVVLMDEHGAREWTPRWQAPTAELARFATPEARLHE